MKYNCTAGGSFWQETSDSAENTADDPSIGPLFGIDYVYVSRCSIKDSSTVHTVLLVVLLLLICILIRTMINVASLYLSSTLERVGEGLHVSEDCIGVTLLAFGNGAPDFFSLVVSASRKIDLLLALSSLLGAGVFLCTIVVGTIAVYSPGPVHGQFVVRDIFFHWISVTLLLGAVVLRITHIWVGVVFILIYILYILFVLYCPTLRDCCETDAGDDVGEEMVQFGTEVSRYGSATADVSGAEIEPRDANDDEEVGMFNGGEDGQHLVVQPADAIQSCFMCNSNESIRSVLLKVIDCPFLFLLGLTIPTSESVNLTGRYTVNAVARYSISVLFVFYSTGFITTPLELFLSLVLAAAVGSFIAGVVQCAVPFAQLAFAFLMCVVWMYMLSGELLTCLIAVGEIVSVPHAFLGLSILAWGNSMSDFFANTTIAKRFLDMALAGSYAGPVFNILIGLGTALVVATIAAHPQQYALQMDDSCKLSLIFLYIILSCSLLAVACNAQFELQRHHGYTLWTMYAIYFTCQMTHLLYV